MKSSSNYIFSWDRALSFDGNTAPYLQYAHARIQSILRKAGEQDIAFEANRFNVGDQAEHDLALHLLRFGSTVVELADALEPHVLCAYLFETAKLFSAFYESCPILKSDVLSITQSRLSLSALTAEVIAKGLDLLGIQAPDRM